MSAASITTQLFGRIFHKVQNKNPLREEVAGSLEFGDFQIDRARRTATLCGRDLDLSCEEFDVLVFIARHPTSVITPSTVLTTKGRPIRQTQFLQTLISLHRKIKSATPANAHYLRTESWVIYRFSPTPTLL